MEKFCGVYQITSSVTGDRYVGSSVDILQRWCEHRSDLSKNCHANAHLQSSFNKYGADTFLFGVICLSPRNELLKTEQFYLDNHKPEYNICKQAYSTRGYKHTEETKKKLSALWSGRKHTDATKELMRSKAHRGSTSPNAKLTEEDVSYIRESVQKGSKSQKELAALFMVSRATINMIVRGTRWRTAPLGAKEKGD